MALNDHNCVHVPLNPNLTSNILSDALVYAYDDDQCVLQNYTSRNKSHCNHNNSLLEYYRKIICL